jgi:adenine-specific DNA-methyltransferase
MTARGDAAVTKPDLPERFDLASVVPIDDRLAAIAAEFPEVVREGKIDFDALRRSLGDWIEPGPERFGLTWPGKGECMRVIQEPSVGTLVPMPDDSVDWDTTQNVIIEGDNLEVLKLMQKAYYGQIKLIYIDPPYNTGKEFIYPDNFREGLADYLRYSGQTNEDGVKLTANTETDGRFHSKWLSMMYPRLFLARNLLKDDGAIFVSIDDGELCHLRLVMDEIFGPEAFLGCITVVSNLKGRSDDKFFASSHNYVLAYARSAFVTAGVPLPEDYLDDYPERTEDGRAFRLLGLRKRGSSARRVDRPNMYYPLYVDPSDRSVVLQEDATHTQKVLPMLSDGEEGRWRWGRETAALRLDELQGSLVNGDRWDVFQVDFAESDEGVRRIVPKTVWMGPEFANEAGTLEVKRVLGKGVFDNPKPIGLVRYILEQATAGDDIVLDFFAGSGTTGHAVMEQNLADGGARRYVLVQLPEPVADADSRTVADITRARVRRASEQIGRQPPTLDRAPVDLGFRSYALRASNFRLWESESTDPASVAEQLDMAVEHITAGATEDTILAELLLKAGYPLTSNTSAVDLEGTQGYSIANGALLVCLSKELAIQAFEAMAEREPAMILVLDAGFGGDDQLKVNALQTVRARNQQSGSDIALRVV